jgi:ribosomal protein L17
MQKPGTSSWQWRELRRAADSGICQRPSSGVTREDIHELAKKQRLIRKSVEDLVRESRVKTFTNRRRSKVKVVVPKSPGFECELVADL